MQHHSIKQKITRRILVINLVTFLLTLTLSYVMLVPPLRQDAVETVEQINTEIVQQIDTLVNFVEDYTENLDLSVQQNTIIRQHFDQPNPEQQDPQQLNLAALQLNNLISYEGLVRCVVIETDLGNSLNSLNKFTDEDFEVLRTEWYQNLSEVLFARGVSPVYQVKINGSIYYTAAYVKNFYHGDRRYTYAVFFDLNDVLNDIEVLASDNLDYYALIDAHGDVFHSGGDDKWSEVADNWSEDSAAPDRSDGPEGISFRQRSIRSWWSVTSFVSNATIIRAFSRYLLGLFGMLLLFLLTTLVFLSRALGRIVRPISALSKTMETAASGNLTCRVEVTSDDEIGRLSRSFNKMIGDLNQSIQVIAEKEKREQQARFSLLVSQIDPHFIYNTINSINYLARKGRCDDVITVNSALITILRDRLRVNDIQITDSIANEMHVLNQYIVIEKYMYDGDLRVTWQVDESLMEEQIPKNMIQPLVENALFHGLIDEENGDVSGEIIIRIERRDNGLVLQVQDDGQGMDAETLRRVRAAAYSPEDRGKRIGLSNIRGRLYYLYGDADCFQIDSIPYGGTCVTLTFPKESH